MHDNILKFDVIWGRHAMQRRNLLKGHATRLQCMTGMHMLVSPHTHLYQLCKDSVSNIH